MEFTSPYRRMKLCLLQETGWNEDQHVKEIIQTHKRKEKAYLLNLLKRTMNCVEQGKRIGIDSIGR